MLLGDNADWLVSKFLNSAVSRVFCIDVTESKVVEKYVHQPSCSFRENLEETSEVENHSPICRTLSYNRGHPFCKCLELACISRDLAQTEQAMLSSGPYGHAPK